VFGNAAPKQTSMIFNTDLILYIFAGIIAETRVI